VGGVSCTTGAGEEALPPIDHPAGTTGRLPVAIDIVVCATENNGNRRRIYKNKYFLMI
jgi:hypothetical protein